MADLAAIEELVTGVNRLADKVGDLSSEVKHYRNRSQTDRLLILCLAIVLIAMAVLFYLEWRSDKRITQIARDGIACLVEQNFEHRYAQGTAHQADADAHGYIFDVNPSNPPTPEQVREAQAALIEKCRAFISKTGVLPTR